MSFVVPDGVVVFSKDVCPNCVTMKNILKQAGVEYTEIKVDENLDALMFLKQAGFRSVPVMFKDGVASNESY